MKTIATTALTIVSLIGTSALAHTDDFLDSQQSPNGGQMRMAGAYHFELVMAKDSKEARDNTIVIYLTDHAGTKISSTGASGTVTLLNGKLKSTATLTPDGGNRLKGVAKYSSDPNMKAVVSITLPGKTTEQARFTPMAKMIADPHAGGGKH